MSAEIIEPCVDDIVARLRDRIGFLSPARGATCEKVGDAALFTAFSQIGAPFAMVQYAGEDALEVENMGAAAVIQQSTMRFQVWCGAKSFSARGEGTDNLHGEVGLNTLVDAVWFALSGYLIPSARQTAGSYMRLFHVSTTPPVVEDYRVISVITFKSEIVRQQTENA